MPTTCSKTVEWDAAHRVLRHEARCATLHGHRYRAEIRCESRELDVVGRVVDFGVIRERVGGWVDEHWDHTTIVNADDSGLVAWCQYEHSARGNRAPYVMPGEPTAENIARVLYGVACELLVGAGVRVVSVTVHETPTCSATYSEEG